METHHVKEGRGSLLRNTYVNFSSLHLVYESKVRNSLSKSDLYFFHPIISSAEVMPQRARQASSSIDTLPSVMHIALTPFAKDPTMTFSTF